MRQASGGDRVRGIIEKHGRAPFQDEIAFVHAQVVLRGGDTGRDDNFRKVENLTEVEGRPSRHYDPLFWKGAQRGSTEDLHRRAIDPGANDPDLKQIEAGR